MKKGIKKQSRKLQIIQIANCCSSRSLTCFRCSCQQVLFLQKNSFRWHAQPQAVRGEFPFKPLSFFRIWQEVHLPWIARSRPLFAPLAVFFTPSRIWKQWAVGSVSSSLVLSCLGLGSSWGMRFATNFQKILSPSASSSHLGSNLRAAKKVSTKVRAEISSCILVCHLLVFHVVCSFKIPCL